MLELVLKFFHLVGFAAFLGGGFAQQQLMKTSSRAGLTEAVRNERESLAAAVATKIEVPGLFAQLALGIGLVALTPTYLKQAWLHGKLTFVLVLLVLSHLEMFNARKIVSMRAEGAPESEIAPLKKKHAVMGAIGGVCVIAVLLFVTVLRAVIP